MSREERRRKVQERLGRKGLSAGESEEVASSPAKGKKQKVRSKAKKKETATSSHRKANTEETSPSKPLKETAEEKKKRREEKRIRREKREQKKQRRATRDLGVAAGIESLGIDAFRSPNKTLTHSSRASSARSDLRTDEKIDQLDDSLGVSVVPKAEPKLRDRRPSSEVRIEQLCSSVSSLKEQVHELSELLEQTRASIATGVSAQCSEVSTVCNDTVTSMKRMMEEFSTAHQQKMEVQREQLRLVRQEKERAASSTDMDDKRKAHEMQALKRFVSTSLDEMKSSIIQTLNAEMGQLRMAVEKPCPRCKDAITPTHIDNAVTVMRSHFDSALSKARETVKERAADSRPTEDPLLKERAAGQPGHAAITGGHTSRDSVDLTSPVNRHLAGLDEDDDYEDMAAESPAEAESGGEEDDLRSRPRTESDVPVVSSVPKPVLRENSPTSEKAVLMQDSTPGIEETSDAWDVSSISSVDETRGNDETSAAPDDQMASRFVGVRDAQVERLSREAGAENLGQSSSLSLTSGGEEEEDEFHGRAPLGEPPAQARTIVQRRVWGVEEYGASEEELVVVQNDQLPEESTYSQSPAATGSAGNLTRQSSRDDTAEPPTQKGYFRMAQSSSNSDAPSPEQKGDSSEEIDTSVSSSAISTSVESDSSSDEEPNRRARAPVTPSWIKK